MITIWKFTIPMAESAEIEMPTGAQLLHVGMQNRSVQLWAQVNTEAPTTIRHFHVRGTGHSIPDNEKHVGSIQDPPFVWHLYEEKQNG